MIEIHDLHKAYELPGGGMAEVLKGIDLLVPDRCITAVVGPSGSGIPDPASWNALNLS